MKRKLQFQNIIAAAVFIAFLVSVIAVGNIRARNNLKHNIHSQEILIPKPSFEEMSKEPDPQFSLETIVYITDSGKCWHRDAQCRSLKNSKVVGISYAQVIIEGKTPCKLCTDEVSEGK